MFQVEWLCFDIAYAFATNDEADDWIVQGDSQMSLVGCFFGLGFTRRREGAKEEESLFFYRAGVLRCIAIGVVFLRLVELCVICAFFENGDIEFFKERF